MMPEEPRYFRCVREWHSRSDPTENHGQIGSIYRLVPNPTEYYMFAELRVGYVNKERFKEVHVHE